MSTERFDPELARLVQRERVRQRDTLNLVPSINHTSRAVRQLVGSVFHDGYSEGTTRLRYYQGNEVVDQMESLAKRRAMELFGFVHVNVQPHSGSPANQAALRAMASYGDTIMGLDISSGGHLTHGAKVSATGEDYFSVPYGVTPEGIIDYDKLEKDAKHIRPKVIIAGPTAYARIVDWERMAEIAHSNGAYLMADMSHVAGLVAGGVYPSPVPYADVVTTTTHKTLRGPRGGLVGVTPIGQERDPDLARRIDSAVFPKLQGGPHENVIAAMALAFKEASTPEFREYAEQILLNAKALANRLNSRGARLITGGTDTHLILLDATIWGITGKTLAEGLEQNARLVTNANGIPFDTRPPLNPSGLRLGTPAVTTRGLDESHMEQIADYIVDVADRLKESKERLGDADEGTRAKRLRIIQGSARETREIKRTVLEMARAHRVPGSYVKAA